MRYTIINATMQKSYETKYGMMDQYSVEVRDEHGSTITAKHSVKQGNQVKINQEGDGQVEDTEFGIKFKWLNTGRPGFGGNYAPKSNRGIALQCACMLEKDQAKVFGLAEKFNNWIENKTESTANPFVNTIPEKLAWQNEKKEIVTKPGEMDINELNF